MPMPDAFDTGYRSAAWDEREPWERRLDYHDMAIDIAAGEMRDVLWKTARSMRDGPEHVHDHVRNTLAALLRYVCSVNYRMNSDDMRAFIRGLADQAYREDRIRIFHCGPPDS
jgi:hypothetical protein